MKLTDLARFQDNDGTYVTPSYGTDGLYLAPISDLIGLFNPQAQGTYLVSGGQVVWDSGLTFTVTAATYFINGVFYSSPSQTHTLDDADPDDPRRDTFYLDTDSDFGAVTGVAASDPQEPSVDPETQIRLVDVLIPAGSSTPSGITISHQIYDENAGTTAEWNTGLIGTGVDFADTTDPFKNTVHISNSGSGNPVYLQFRDSVTNTIPTSDKLVFRIYPVDNIVGAARLTFYLWDQNGGSDFALFTLSDGQYGFDGKLNEYQTIAIPISDMNPSDPASIDIDTIYIAPTIQARSKEFYIDDIFIQSGVTQPGNTAVEVKVGNTLFVDTVYGDDSTGERENFIKPYATASAAEADAQSGDTIYFRAGTHTIGSSLTTAGITYYVSPGAILTKSSGNMFAFTSSGNYYIQCDGQIQTTGSADIVALNHASAVGHFNIDRAYTEAGGISILDAGNIYLRTREFIGVSNSGTLTYNGGANSIFTWDFDYIKSDNRIHKIGGRSNTGAVSYIRGNYAKNNNTSVDDIGFFIDGDGTFKGNSVHVSIKNYDQTSTNDRSSAFNPREGGALYVYDTRITYTHNNSPVIQFNEDGGSVGAFMRMENCTVAHNSTSANRPVIALDLDDDFLELDNVVLVNNNTGASGRGILASITSGSGSSNVDLKDVIIRLNSTAVGAGAAALTGASLNYRMFSDCRSNGAWGGTNLVTSTIGIVDSEFDS